MKNIVKKAVQTLVLSLLALPALAQTPFTDVFFDEAPYVKVQVAGATYNHLGINGNKRADIMEKCEAAYAEKCSCQFAEKFEETMAQIGLPVTGTVTLRLYTISNHSIQTIDVPVSAENQDELMVNREMRNEVCAQ